MSQSCLDSRNQDKLCCHEQLRFEKTSARLAQLTSHLAGPLSAPADAFKCDQRRENGSITAGSMFHRGPASPDVSVSNGC